MRSQAAEAVVLAELRQQELNSELSSPRPVTCSRTG